MIKRNDYLVEEFPGEGKLDSNRKLESDGKEEVSPSIVEDLIARGIPFKKIKGLIVVAE